MSVKAKRNISSILRDMLRKPQLQYGSEENALEVGLHQCGYYFHTFVSL